MNNSKQHLGMFAAGWFLVIMGIIFCFIEEIAVGITFGGFLGIPLVVGFWPKSDKKEREQARQQEEERQKEQQRKLERYASGTWNFPTLKLYDKCAASGVKELDTEFSLQKAMQVATAIMTSEGVPQEYHGKYCNKDTIKTHFATGKGLRTGIEEKAEKRRRAPKAGKLDEQEMRCVQMAISLRSKWGHDKRLYMLSRAIDDINTRIKEYREGQEAMRSLGMIYASSVSQTPKHDWAILGGIADGIAGPGAGAAVALNAMMENEKIEEQNRQARAAAAQFVGELYSGSAQLDSSIGGLESEKNRLQEYREEVAYKVVLDGYAKEDLFKALDISAKVSKLSGGKGLKLTATISNKFKADVPDGVKVATDGTLEAKIFFENNLVDEVCVPLPLFGVECVRGLESVEMYSDRYVEAGGKYTVKFEPINLWIIEI